jgi:putative FmdB family regulatory protein
MPLYSFRCPQCDEFFDRLAKMDDVSALCRCGEVAKRIPFYEQTAIIDRAAPPPGEYADEAQKKGLKTRGWDYDRSLEEIRKAVREDDQGHKRLDTSLIPNT